jgi:mono/diheme cytochrome c family protein
MTRYMLIPLAMGGWVAVVSLTLIGIILLGPYTHNNLAAGPDPGYTRTMQETIGMVMPYQGPGTSRQLPSDQIARGRALMVSKSCATCHGLDGRGGVIGKPIVGFSATQLRAKTTQGPGEMPAFSTSELSDQDLAAIAAYLKSLQKTSP